jgi:hypothetical protein
MERDANVEPFAKGDRGLTIHFLRCEEQAIENAQSTPLEWSIQLQSVP